MNFPPNYRLLAAIKCFILLLVIMAISCTSHAQNVWSQKTDFTGYRSRAAGFVINDKIYIGTGDAGGDLQKDLWVYNPSNNSWTQKANLPAEGRDGAIAFSIEGKGYLGTGHTGNG